MKALGGILEKTEIDPYDAVLTSVYCFNVDETINKYKETYKNNVYINSSIE